MNTKPTVEQLLTPRFEIIEDYPYNSYLIGTVLTPVDEEGKIIQLSDGRLTHARTYPKLFKKLSWYEKRTIEELPNYVKHIKYPDTKIMVKEWFAYNGIWFKYGDCATYIHPEDYLPITAVEYSDSSIKK